MNFSEMTNFTKEQAAQKYAKLFENDEFHQPEIPEEFLPFRNELMSESNKRSPMLPQHKYQYDLQIALKLYEMLQNEANFTKRIASSDNFWNYLNLVIFPDLLEKRWGNNPERYYQSPRRSYLRALYWYIELSWQGNQSTTFEILQNNTTDILVQLVERPGMGYYLPVYREIMKQYSKTSRDSALFRQIMKLNTAWLIVLSPELYSGGTEKYVSDLINTIKSPN